VVEGESRARFDSAHAQRVIGISDAGDHGLIALVRATGTPKKSKTLK
jgi:hypothetical protein